MQWALAIVALTLLGVAAISRRLYGDAGHAGDGLRRGRVAGRTPGARRDRPRELELDRADAGGGDAGARAVLRRIAHRSPAASPRGRGAGAPARDRTAADDRARRRRGGRRLRPADRRGGRDPGDRSWRRPTPRWGRRSSPSRASPGGSARGSTSRAGSTTGSACRCCSRPWPWPTWNRRSRRAAARARCCSRRSATGSSAA